LKGGENMKKFLGISILSVLVLSFFAVPALVSARCPETPCPPGSGQLCNLAGECVAAGSESPIKNVTDIDALVRAVARWIAIVVSVIAVIFIILGGVSYITAGGDEEKAKGARQKIVYGLVGLAIAALAWGAESIVRSALSLK